MMKVLLAGVLSLVLMGEEAKAVKTVGSGAVGCNQFNEDYTRDPYSERGYFAWAQGLMTGILLRAPEGVDEDLDLIPPAMPIQNQMAFIRRFCAASPEEGYQDAILALYKELRKVGGGS
jgi:hypothetical protein